MFDKYFDMKDNFTLSYMRTYISYGLPLEIEGKRFQNKSDDLLLQQAYLKDFARMIRDKLDKKFGDGSGNKPMKSSFLTVVLLIEQFESLLMNDFFFTVFSLLFVFIYMAIHLRSPFLSWYGTLLIIFSFPFTMIIVAGIF